MWISKLVSLGPRPGLPVLSHNNNKDPRWRKKENQSVYTQVTINKTSPIWSIRTRKWAILVSKTKIIRALKDFLCRALQLKQHTNISISLLIFNIRNQFWILLLPISRFTEEDIKWIIMQMIPDTWVPCPIIQLKKLKSI